MKESKMTKIIKEPSYVYKARVVSIYDADTFRANVDLGFGVWQHNEPLRLARIDAPELRGSEREEGLISRDWLFQQMPIASEIVIETFSDKKGKYGRYICNVWKDGVCLNDAMVEAGLAKYHNY